MDDTLMWVRWLWQRHGFHMFPADHPGNPECVGAHWDDKPCDGKRGKHPCGKWSRGATNDPALLRVMFSRGLRNIGIACRKSGLLVVDEDTPGALQRYADSVGKTIPLTFSVNTGRAGGGTHFYWRMPEGVELGNGAGALKGRGIDVRGARGHGGYVIGPGSVHESGIVYQPVDMEAPILPAPAWLVEALQTPHTPTFSPDPRKSLVSTGRGHPYKVLTGLVQTVLDATPGVDRNNRLFWSAARMFEHAERGLFPAESGRVALLEAARRVGLNDGEAEATLDSARRNARGR